jgi:hypothetical protein
MMLLHVGCTGPVLSSGIAQLITSPVLISDAASATIAGVMKFAVPRSSSSPQRPQLLGVRWLT